MQYTLEFSSDGSAKPSPTFILEGFTATIQDANCWRRNSDPQQPFDRQKTPVISAHNANHMTVNFVGVEMSTFGLRGRLTMTQRIDLISKATGMVGAVYALYTSVPNLEYQETAQVQGDSGSGSDLDLESANEVSTCILFPHDDGVDALLAEHGVWAKKVAVGKFSFEPFDAAKHRDRAQLLQRTDVRIYMDCQSAPVAGIEHRFPQASPKLQAAVSDARHILGTTQNSVEGNGSTLAKLIRPPSNLQVDRRPTRLFWPTGSGEDVADYLRHVSRTEDYVIVVAGYSQRVPLPFVRTVDDFEDEKNNSRQVLSEDDHQLLFGDPGQLVLSLGLFRVEEDGPVIFLDENGCVGFGVTCNTTGGMSGGPTFLAYDGKVELIGVLVGSSGAYNVVSCPMEADRIQMNA